jgi:hypothetical protein
MGLAEINVVPAASEPPVVMPAVMVVALPLVFVNTARPILLVVWVGQVYTEASELAS